MTEHETPDPLLESARAALDGRRGRAWREALTEEAAEGPVREWIEREFPSVADRLVDPVGRRDFLRLAGASLAAAGLSACTRQPKEVIAPFASRPENRIPGRPQAYATSFAHGGSATGLLVEAHEGRPTKVEGNPDHPSSLGSADGFAQAQILDLYDPERSEAVLRAGAIETWDSFIAALGPRVEGHLTREGEGLALLTEPVVSPTMQALIERALERMPKMAWHTWTPVHRDSEREGALRALGADLTPVLHLDRARCVLTLDGDPLASGPGSVRNARDFASARKGRHDTDELVRLYAIETVPTLTGAMADHRITARSAEVERLARALARAVGVDAPGPEPEAAHVEKIAGIAADLKAAGSAAVVVAGPWQSAAVHALAAAMNVALGAAGTTVEYVEPPAAQPDGCGASITALADAMRGGAVETLLMVGGNPVHDAPAETDFGGALDAVAFRAHMSLHEDETSALSHWHLPAAHFLECWGDARAHDGTAGIQQPLIKPLYAGRAPLELVAVLAGEGGKGARDLVRAHWGSVWGSEGDALDRAFSAALHDGVVAGTASEAVTPRSGAVDLPPAPARGDGGLEVAFRPDASAFDGRFANNAWLQETPRPLSRLVWGNAALLAPATAKQLGVSNEDVISVEVDGKSVELPVWETPGAAVGVIGVHLGYGRTVAGWAAEGVGTDVYPLRTASAPWHAGATVKDAGRRGRLISVQGHAEMEGRNLVRRTTLPVVRGEEHEDHHGVHHLDPKELSMIPEHPYEGNAWGMVIDLNACTGCNACMLACQSENNIPVVGADEVEVGREMHWIRIDRYYAWDDEETRAFTHRDHGDHAEPSDRVNEEPEVLHQPVPCMQCEKAPCELVCPVGATVHSDEGLNDMVYNRCVGTRYCANNCPYKVRRFNFKSYSASAIHDTLALGTNPDVTVRSRGVMEKCTYCVQRISSARIDAKVDGREVTSSDIQTACQQTCPSQAIVFGDINDPESEVSRLRSEPHHYKLLEELGAEPRTTYLSKLNNPNPDLLKG
jgi:molybdopterin-containing oxidoreductase family iron-sulfur binding subunit